MNWKDSMRRWFAGFVLVLLLATGCSHLQATDDTLRFVQITDTHFGKFDHNERTKKAVDMINSLPVDISCVVLTGDIMSDNYMTNGAEIDKGLEILGRLKAPLHILPGNHDIKRRTHDAHAKIYRERFGEFLAEKEYNGVVFLFVYTEPLAHAFDAEEFQPLEELEAALKRAGNKPVLVFHHTPSVTDFYNNGTHRGWHKDIRDQWVELLNHYKVKAVIAGHFHRDEHHWLGEVPLYVSSSIAGFWGRQATYRIYEYRDGKISYRTQYIRMD